MPTTWKLVVTEFGSQEPLHQVVAEGEDWLLAFRAGRAALREEPSLPPGASCTFAAGGAVSILDAAARKKYVLSPVGGSTPAAATPQASSPTSERPPATSTTRPSRPPLSLPLGEVIGQRDEAPTQDSPITYAERSYAVPQGTSAELAEEAVRAWLVIVQRELSAQDPGKFVQLAVFDHAWIGRPARPPLVTLQWKDWKGDVVVAFPSRTAQRDSDAPQRSSRPSDRPPSKRPPSREAEERLAQAFEDCQDLFFVRSPMEGAEFVLRLLADSVPSEAISVCLYDIDRDEMRFVATSGPGAELRRASAVPGGIGILGAASKDPNVAILVEAPEKDPRFNAVSDGRQGISVHTMAAVGAAHEGRLYGVIQLFNRTGQAQFSRADGNVLGYIGEQFAAFLHSMKKR